MKQIPILISTITLILLAFSCSKTEDKQETKRLKSVYGFQNDTIVNIKEYDKKGRLIFDRTTQIIEDWDNELMSWMTAYQFDNDKLKYEYYAHSNTGLRIKLYDYDQSGELRNEYLKNFSDSHINGRNPFSEIYKIETADSLISYISKAIPDTLTFNKKNRFKRESTEFHKTYLDSQNLEVKEFWTIEDSIEIKRLIEQYDSKGNLVFKHSKNQWDEGIERFRFDTEGNLIEELEIYTPEENNFQKKEHFYSNGLLQKTLFYHDTALAFTYEYFYNDTVLDKEIKTRVTEAEHFKDRKKKEIIEYQYEYFE